MRLVACLLLLLASASQAGAPSPQEAQRIREEMTRKLINEGPSSQEGTQRWMRTVRRPEVQAATPRSVIVTAQRPGEALEAAQMECEKHRRAARLTGTGQGSSYFFDCED